MVVGGGGGQWVCKPVLVFSLSLGQAEQLLNDDDISLKLDVKCKYRINKATPILDQMLYFSLSNKEKAFLSFIRNTLYICYIDVIIVTKISLQLH